MNGVATSLNRHLARTVQVTTQLKRLHTQPYMIARTVAGLDLVARGIFHVWRNRRYLSVVKLINMAIVNIQFKLKSERLLGRPYKMKIESTNICNTKCQLCPTGIGLQGRPKGKMSLTQYKRLVDQLRHTLVALDLSMWGDPLIVPEIYDMIRYAHRRRIWTYVSSNLHAFKTGKGQAQALVNSGLDMLTCSLHGASQETFGIYQPGKNFQETIAKVRHIVDTRNQMNSATPDIQLNFVVTRHNEHEKTAFQTLSEQLGCKAVFSDPALNTRFLGLDDRLHRLDMTPDELEKKTHRHLKQWLPTDPQHVLAPYRQMLSGTYSKDAFNGRKLMDCSWPWRESVINWDGQVVTCCGSFDPKQDMGNVFEQPFGKIWNGTQYRMARRSFKRKLTPEQARDNPCASCPGFMV